LVCDLWDASERQGKVIEEQEKKIVNLEKLLVGQLDHIMEVTRLVDQVVFLVLFLIEGKLTIVSSGSRLPVPLR